MNKRFFSLSMAFVMVMALMSQGRAKYVFYFIGDGMGVNQVNGTETYLGALEGRIGVSPLTFTQFPAVGIVNTQSATNGVTDSAASGTALACGRKTKNGALGMLADLTTSISSVAAKAKEAGMAVGVATSVSVDHATPAAFYAHVPERGMYHRIGKDLITAGFDFYAGADFRNNEDKADTLGTLHEQCGAAGYTLVRNYREYQKKRRRADKMLLLQGDKPSHGDRTCLPYAIDRQKDDLTLQQITRAGLSFLAREDKGKDGFFLMVEGGKIDWACHGNDPATVFEEVVDMDNAIKVAYEFYKKHPKETLIVVTADHETGGLGLGTGKYELQLKALAKQKQSQDILSRSITDLRKMRKVINWPEMKEFLAEKMGFWKELPVSWEQEKMLRDAYEESFVNKHVVFEESLYAKTEPLAVAAKKVMSQIAMVGWTSGGHTAGYVPVFAVGAGSKLFVGKMDNTEIPKRIAKAGGYK